MRSFTKKMNDDLSFLEDSGPAPTTATGELMEYVNNLDQINTEIADLEKQLDERKQVKKNLALAIADVFGIEYRMEDPEKWLGEIKEWNKENLNG